MTIEEEQDKLLEQVPESFREFLKDVAITIAVTEKHMEIPRRQNAVLYHTNWLIDSFKECLVDHAKEQTK